MKRRVRGTVVSTICSPVFEARKLLICDLEDGAGRPSGSYTIAVDAVGVGVGERVLIIDEGNSARQVVAMPDAPIRAVIIGKVDAETCRIRSDQSARARELHRVLFDRLERLMTVVETTSEAISGVDFSLTDQQRAVRDAARVFARKEIDPIVEEIDEAQRFPKEIFDHAGELGFLGVLVPEDLGGAGLGYVDYVLILDEISAVDPAVGLSVAAHNSLCTNHILKFGDAQQKQRWLPDLAHGRLIGAWSLTEPNAGSDAAGTQATAKRVAGGWVLNGSKTFTTHGSVGGVCVVMAVTDREGPRHHSISAFVLEKGMEGFRPGKKENKLGSRASDTAEVVMEDCFVANEHLLGEPGEGFVQALEILDGGRISIAALGLGTARGAYETALEYSKHREQFGKPIAGFQAIQFHLAEMATRIAAAEALTLSAALAMDGGGKVSRLAAEAKLYAGETAVFCAERGVQIHGGYGYIKDYRAEKYYRDCKICTIGEGTSEIQRLVIARQLLKGH